MTALFGSWSWNFHLCSFFPVTLCLWHHRMLWQGMWVRTKAVYLMTNHGKEEEEHRLSRTHPKCPHSSSQSLIPNTSISQCNHLAVPQPLGNCLGDQFKCKSLCFLLFLVPKVHVHSKFHAKFIWVIYESLQSLKGSSFAQIPKFQVCPENQGKFLPVSLWKIKYI